MQTSRSKPSSTKYSELYTIIKNALPHCQTHNLICQMYDRAQKQFTCEQCSQHLQSSVKVNDILLNSTLLMQDEINKNSAIFLKTQLQKLSILQKNYRRNSEMLDEYFGEIQKQIKKFIKRIKDSYRKTQQNLNECSNIAGQIREVCSTYNNFLIQQLQNQFQQGTTEQLLSIFKKFSSINQNPFPKVSEKIDKLSFQMQKCSNIDWKKIQNIYQRVTDPFLWQVQQVIIPYASYVKQKNRVQDKIYLPNNPPALLSDFQYLIKATQKQIQLLKPIQLLNNDHEDSFDLQNSKASQSQQFLTQFKSSVQCNNIDMIYELPERKILTISYDKLEIYSYKFEQLVKQKVIQLSGCTEVLNLQSQVILLANENIYKINYKNAGNHQSLQKIFSGYSSINYIFQQNKKSLCVFEAFNQQNQRKILNL